MGIGGQEKRGSEETWEWRDMVQEKHGTGETWDWRNVGQEKQTQGPGETDGTGETWVRRNVGQENHRTRETRHWVQEKHGTGQRGSEETDDRKKKHGTRETSDRKNIWDRRNVEHV